MERRSYFYECAGQGRKKCHTGVIQESWCLLLYDFCMTPKRLVEWSFSGLEASPKIGMNPMRDRKSTRLNASHVAISYAVFCLKKKKDGLTLADLDRGD